MTGEEFDVLSIHGVKFYRVWKQEQSQKKNIKYW